MIKVSIVSDDSGHYYIIPTERYKRFNQLMSLEEEGEYDIEIEFSQYVTGGCINGSGIQLYADIK